MPEYQKEPKKPNPGFEIGHALTEIALDKTVAAETRVAAARLLNETLPFIFTQAGIHARKNAESSE
ncbi:MAG: hypothetical protein WC565_10640 [Parcubacteria group bacterium]